MLHRNWIPRCAVKQTSVKEMCANCMRMHNVRGRCSKPQPLSRGSSWMHAVPSIRHARFTCTHAHAYIVELIGLTSDKSTSSWSWNASVRTPVSSSSTGSLAIHDLGATLCRAPIVATSAIAATTHRIRPSTNSPGRKRSTVKKPGRRLLALAMACISASDGHPRPSRSRRRTRSPHCEL